MEYRVEVSEDGQYVIATTVGDVTRTDGIEITRSMYELGLRVGINCYLADARRARNIDRAVESVHFALRDLPLVPGMDVHRTCMALLVDPADHSHDFYAAFMTSQGIDTTVFWDYDEAVEHLERAAERLAYSDSQELR